MAMNYKVITPTEVGRYNDGSPRIMVRKTSIGLSVALVDLLKGVLPELTHVVLIESNDGDLFIARALNSKGFALYYHSGSCKIKKGGKGLVNRFMYQFKQTDNFHINVQAEAQQIDNYRAHLLLRPGR
jgi:hypothetical protein